MSKKQRNYRLTSDPGHGWLSVPLKEIAEFNLSDKISPYSYINLSRAYLEEDSDMSIFLNRLKELNIDYNIKATSTEKTNIRNMCSYSQEALQLAIDLKKGMSIALYNPNEKNWTTKGLITDISPDKKTIFIQNNDTGQVYKSNNNNILQYIRPLKKLNSTIIKNLNDVPFNCVIENSSDKDDIVKIHDYRFKTKENPDGQFITSYYLTTLIESEQPNINLDTGSKDWTLDQESFKTLKGWLKSHQTLTKNIKKTVNQHKP